MYDARVTVQDKKVYVAGGSCPVDDTMHQVYVYDINTDHWDQLPPPGHYCGVPCVIGGKLAIIGGRLSATNQRTNKVSTFHKASQTWISYFPDLLSVRNRPGVVTHLENVIVAGGFKGDGSTPVGQDDIEILNWTKNFQWRKASINLPVPMGSFTPSLADGYLIIVGYANAATEYENYAYKIPVNDITKSGDQQQTSSKSAKWITMINDAHLYTALVPSSAPPVVVGGLNQGGATTSAIQMYDNSCKSFKSVSSLSSARCAVAIAAVNNNAIIVLGGYTKGGDVDDAVSSSLTTVELGQAQIKH